MIDKRKQRKIENEDELTQSDRDWMRSRACFLKATGLSYRKISDAVGVTGRMVRRWFEEDEMQKRVAELRKDMTDTAIMLLNQMSVEAVSLLMDNARRANADGLYRDSTQAVIEVLDRVGLSKVNKSESRVTRTEQHEHTLSKDVWDKFESLPLETQKKLADLSEEMEGLVAEAANSG